MRRAAWLAIVLGCGAAGPCAAQTFSTPALPLERPAPAASDLFQAPFAARHSVAAATFRPVPIDRPLVLAHTFSFGAGPLGLDVSPQITSRPGRTTAGAALRLRTAREQAALNRLDDLGVREGARAGLADKARWYLFAAASGRGVGLNMLHRDGAWNRAGWTTDPTSGLVGDGQVALAWRKGPFQSAFGVITREVRGNHMMFGQHTYEDYVAAWSFSIRPQW